MPTSECTSAPQLLQGDQSIAGRAASDGLDEQARDRRTDRQAAASTPLALEYRVHQARCRSLLARTPDLHSSHGRGRQVLHLGSHAGTVARTARYVS